jgi:hypothetical protein
MKSVAISASPKQLSRLRNGHRVRISGAIKGEGINLLVDPSKFDQMTRSFAKGMASQVQLAPEEILANKKAIIEGELSGEGIFAGGKLKTKSLKKLKAPGVALLGVAKKTGTTLGKPFEKTVQVNPFTLGYDIGHDVIAPELIHAMGRQTEEEYNAKKAKEKAQKGGKITLKKVGKTLSDFGKKAGKAIVEAEQKVRENPTSRAIVKKVLPVVAKIAVTAAAQRAGLDPASTKELSGLAQQGSTAGLTEAGYGLYAGHEGQGLYAGARGRGLLGPPSRMPEYSSLMIGGSLLGMQNPALKSDAESANFHMNTQLPPQFQRGGIRFV